MELLFLALRVCDFIIAMVARSRSRCQPEGREFLYCLLLIVGPAAGVVSQNNIRLFVGRVE